MLRLESAIKAAQAGSVSDLKAFSVETVLSERDDRGSSCLHWAAGNGHLDAVRYLVDQLGMPPDLIEGQSVSGNLAASKPNVAKRPLKKSRGISGRGPLHFAARNGHLEVVKHLCTPTSEGGAGACAELRASDGVTPLQHAVWQNHLPVCQYLVEVAGADPRQFNAFGCGLQHWIGLAPASRAVATSSYAGGHTGDAVTTQIQRPKELNGVAQFDSRSELLGGEGLLPLASWLQDSCGVDFSVPQAEGHTPLHKAAWGGHTALCAWLLACGSCTYSPGCSIGNRSTISSGDANSSSNSGFMTQGASTPKSWYSVDKPRRLDNKLDRAGNSAADIADMGGHRATAAWLRQHASPARARAVALLGVPYYIGPGDPELRAAYLRLSKASHPDRRHANSSTSSTDCNGNASIPVEDTVASLNHAANSSDSNDHPTTLDAQGTAQAADANDTTDIHADGEILTPPGPLFADIAASYRLLTDATVEAAAAQRNQQHALPPLLRAAAERMHLAGGSGSGSGGGSGSGSGSGSGGGGESGTMKEEEVVKEISGSSSTDEKSTINRTIEGSVEAAAVISATAPLKDAAVVMAPPTLRHHAVANVNFTEAKQVFAAQLASAVREYGPQGLPLALLPKKFKQVRQWDGRKRLDSTA